MRLKDHVAIITGGGRGIGRAICVNMAKEGAKIAIPDLNADAAKQTVDMIKRDGGEAMGLKVDVTKKPEVQGMVNDVLKAYGQIHVLINNAGIDIKGAVTELEESTWDRIMDLNLKAVFLCTQAVLPSMIEQRYGRIISISSMAGKTGEAFTSPYCASKFGVIGFTQAVALEVGKYAICVNAICPGPVETELIKQSVAQAAELKGMDPEKFFQSFYIDPTPLGRIARPLDVARAAVFLASEDAEFITGTTLNVSGGREMH